MKDFEEFYLHILDLMEYLPIKIVLLFFTQRLCQNAVDRFSIRPTEYLKQLLVKKIQNFVKCKILQRHEMKRKQKNKSSQEKIIKKETLSEPIVKRENILDLKVQNVIITDPIVKEQILLDPIVKKEPIAPTEVKQESLPLELDTSSEPADTQKCILCAKPLKSENESLLSIVNLKRDPIRDFFLKEVLQVKITAKNLSGNFPSINPRLWSLSHCNQQLKWASADMQCTSTARLCRSGKIRSKPKNISNAPSASDLEILLWFCDRESSQRRPKSGRWLRSAGSGRVFESVCFYPRPRGI